MFRKGMFVLTVACLLVAGTLGAAWATPKQDITVQPFGLLFGQANAEYEFAVSGASALAFRANYFSWTISDLGVAGIGAGASYRFYPASKGQAPKGFFVGPAVDVTSVSASDDDDTATSMFYSAGAEVGYRWMWGEETAFVLAPSLNVGFRGGSFDVGSTTVTYEGVGMGLGVALGIGF